MKKNNEKGSYYIATNGISIDNSLLWYNSELTATFYNSATINGMIVPTKEKPITEFQLFEKVKELIKKTK